MSKKTTPKHVLHWPEWTLVGIVAVSTLLIIISLCTGLLKSPTERAEIEMDKLAEAYYTEYLYPRLLGNLNNDPAKVLPAYTESGVPTTYLRQMLHYNDDEHAKSAGYFEAVECDTNDTGVRYFPVEPYGPRDYTTVYFWRCANGEFEAE